MSQQQKVDRPTNESRGPQEGAGGRREAAGELRREQLDETTRRRERARFLRAKNRGRRVGR
jgi:hypothetical protein